MAASLEAHAMSILPLMDALILLGWSSLVAGGLLKAVYVTTHYRPTILGLGPADFLAAAAVALLFALTLAARTWVKAAEPELLRRRRRHYEPGVDERLGAEETPALEAAPLREARR
jgi:hypothetical protein